MRKTKDEGFIKVYRGFTEWEWYTDNITKAVFLHCLIKANWKETRYRGEVVPRGGFVTGRQKLAEELNVWEQSIRTALNHLKSTNELTIKTTSKFSIITVVNWDKYQLDNQVSNQQLTNN